MALAACGRQSHASYKHYEPRSGEKSKKQPEWVRNFLLSYSRASEFADQAIEGWGLLILWLHPALVDDAYIDVFVDALKGIASLRWRQCSFAAPDSHDWHL